MAVLLLSAVGAGAAPEAPLQSTYLPLVVRDHRHRRPCPADSPFSLQIAALHEVEAPSGDLSGVFAQRRDEQRAWLDEAFPTLVDAMRDSGACWSRVFVDWSAIEPRAPIEGQPPDYSPGALAWYDEKLALVEGAGVRLIALVEAVPEWAAVADDPVCAPAPKCAPVHPDRLDDFAQFLTDMVNRYKQPPYNIHHWELRNEPDGTSASRAGAGQGCGGRCGSLYAEMLQVAYPAIKAADPEATVLMGGLAYDRFLPEETARRTQPDAVPEFYRYFPDDMLQAIQDMDGIYPDILNVHFFTDFRGQWERWTPDNPPTCGDVDDGLGTPYEAWGIDLIAKINHFRNRLSTCFGVEGPIWVTEMAEHGWNYDDWLVRQARYVIQGYARGLAAGVENITWFALVSPPYDGAEQGLLFKNTLEPKPAYRAYQTLTAQLSGYQYAHTLDAPDVEGYAFRNAAGEKIVAWGSGVVTVAAGRVSVVDRNGQITWVEDGGPADLDGAPNGSLSLQMTDEPVFMAP